MFVGPVLDQKFAVESTFETVVNTKTLLGIVRSLDLKNDSLSLKHAVDVKLVNDEIHLGCNPSLSHWSSQWVTIKTQDQNQNRSACMQDVYEFTIAGKCIPKARPRFSGHAYTPIKYKEWKDNAVKQLSRQYQGQPLTDCSIRIVFYGKHRGDLDNLAGSVINNRRMACQKVNPPNLRKTNYTPMPRTDLFHAKILNRVNWTVPHNRY